jgi:hypothetical protein
VAVSGTDWRTCKTDGYPAMVTLVTVGAAGVVVGEEGSVG